jgi:hypothetical protein
VNVYSHIKINKRRTTFLAFWRYLRSLYPLETRIAIVLDNCSPHLSTRVDTRAGTGLPAATSSSRTCQPTPQGCTGSKLSSRRCAASPSTAPTTPPTKNRTR